MTNWSEWLTSELEKRGWRQADFVRESHGTIQRDRVSKWLNGDSRPSHRYAIITANTLGTSHEEALRAAGFDFSPVEDALALALGNQLNRGLTGYTELELIDELRRRARERQQES